MFKLPFHRKKLFVNAGIQGKIALRFGFYWVIYHLCLWNGAFMYFFMRSRLSQLTGSGEAMLSVSDLYAKFLSEYLPLTLAATLLLPIVIYELIRQTHRRSAGPLFPRPERDDGGPNGPPDQAARGGHADRLREAVQRVYRVLPVPDSRRCARQCEVA